MERMTYRLEDQYGNYICTGTPKKLEVVLSRLAAYEDTGLEPEEIELLAKQRDLYVDACGELPLKRIRELAQTDREGRVVVLPCKKGDVVWRIVNDANPYITKDRCTEIVLENGNVWAHLIGDRVMGGWNFGKLLFLTREAAEEALKAREQE